MDKSSSSNDYKIEEIIQTDIINILNKKLLFLLLIKN